MIEIIYVQHGVLTLQNCWNCFFLDWARLFKPLLKNSHKKLSFKHVVFKIVAMCASNVLVRKGRDEDDLERGARIY